MMSLSVGNEFRFLGERIIRLMRVIQIDVLWNEAMSRFELKVYAVKSVSIKIFLKPQ